MTESDRHKRAKSKAAGRAGETEAPLRGNRRLDALSSNKAVEIELSGTINGLEKAAKRLKDSGKPQKVLQVPQKDMAKAAKAMQTVGISGTVKNMGGTKRRSITKKK
ncbi:MAG: hypothetical protein JRJ18_07455 [Deltaproteobacteria bacterium]|nr:hypothetical protein [Deltaproteobacteria bacterium]MBW1995653.1 hypothetical protein [Deltaproteobacteria bacterium]